jgi:chemotaxis methyl-accepting protein methylase
MSTGLDVFDRTVQKTNLWLKDICRNLVFTYFAAPVQQDILARMVARLLPGGILLVGKHESLPQDCQHVVAYDAPHGLFQKVAVFTTVQGDPGRLCTP